MTVVIDGSASATFATPLPVAQGGTGSATALGSGAPMLSAQTGSAPVYGCRAFCTWAGATAGTYTPTLPSGNISSIVRNSVGNYTLNFTTAMADAEYAVVFGADGISTLGSANSAYPMVGVTSKTASSVTVQYFAYAGSTNIPAAYDPTRAHLSIFR